MRLLAVESASLLGFFYGSWPGTFFLDFNLPTLLSCPAIQNPQFHNLYMEVCRKPVVPWPQFDSIVNNRLCVVIDACNTKVLNK
jgi:hypothetical protein